MPRFIYVEIEIQPSVKIRKRYIRLERIYFFISTMELLYEIHYITRKNAFIELRPSKYKRASYGSN